MVSDPPERSLGASDPRRSTTAPDDARSRARGVDVGRYLARIGLDVAAVETVDLDTLEILQRAHVTSVPFENLAIVGDPHGDDPGSGVDLTPDALFEKIVERERGGYCFELNGLFTALLDALGFQVERVAARVESDLTVPANHHVIVVTLDRRYVVDVGTGAPMLRRPVPLDGTIIEDELGIEWRVTDSDRPDESHRTEYREPGADEWSSRYVFSHHPRALSYFMATNDYLQSAPESPFTDGPVVQRATTDGHVKLTVDRLTDPLDDTDDGTRIPAADWHDVLAAQFGIRLEAPVRD